MGSEKHGSSESSSDDKETSNYCPSPATAADGSKEGFGRSYECSFCKRGFTNAQALGGHMNIHRKDKAKAKKHEHAFTTPTPLANKPNPKVSSSKSFSFIPYQDEADRYLGSSLFGSYTGDQSNPNFHWTKALPLPQEDLNLKIGTSEIGNSNIGFKKIGQEDSFENDVDLELRLGHYP